MHTHIHSFTEHLLNRYVLKTNYVGGVLMAWDTPLNKTDLPASYSFHEAINITNTVYGLLEGG